MVLPSTDPYTAIPPCKLTAAFGANTMSAVDAPPETFTPPVPPYRI